MIQLELLTESWLGPGLLGLGLAQMSQALQLASRLVHQWELQRALMLDHWWVPGCTIGYEHTFINALADFLHGAQTGSGTQPDFRNALQTQRVCDAVLESARSGQWVQTGAEV